MKFHHDWERICEFCKLLYEVSRIPMQILDERSISHFHFPSLPEFEGIGLSHTISENLIAHAQQGPVLQTFRSILLYACIPFQEDEQSCYLILGPALLGEISQNGISSVAPLYSCQDTHRLYAAARRLPVHNTVQFVRYAQMLYLTIFGESIGLSDFFITQQKQLPQEAIERALESSYFAQRELTNMPVSFEHEQMFTECVKTGNTAELKRLLDTYISGTAGTLSSNPLRQSKDTCIAIAAVIARAAIAGGMSAESACRLSDVYVQQVEACGEVKDVYMLCARLVFDLTERVANVQRQTAYSFPITQCVQYITDHLHEELSLQILAEQVQLSPRYLSRLFKQETGATITSYIQRARVREAQNLLLLSDESFLEISNFLHFVSQSYFIQIFKRYTGMTPQQYRKRGQRIFDTSKSEVSISPREPRGKNDI